MVSIIRCVNGHFYDAGKSKECPYCRRPEGGMVVELDRSGPGVGVAGGIGEDVTVAKMPEMPGSVSLRGREAGVAGLGAPDEGVTVAVFSQAAGTAFVTGWLVGLTGAVKGRDYRIRHGVNWVGRDFRADICIREAKDIDDLKQCALIYDGRGNRFYVRPGTGSVTYLNGEILDKPQQLQLGDVLQMGSESFEFVPFCREGRVWEA